MFVRPSARLLALGVALATVLTPLALSAGLSDATAAAPKQHYLSTYKVEKQVELDGEFPDNVKNVDLNCNPGDYVLDGMWRVDAVDQPNPDLGVSGDERDIIALASYSDSANLALWHFRLVNNSVGASAQLKVFVTCLERQTQVQNGHQHLITYNPRLDRTVTLSSVLNPVDHTATCSASQLPVAPGFEFLAGSARLYQSWPTASMLSWHWAFVANDSATVRLSMRCLNIKTGTTSGHAHNLKYSWMPGYAGILTHLPMARQVNRELSCGAQEKGMVGAFWIDDPFHVWFLGMDPRPKIRNFRYYNDGGGSDSVYHGLLCLNIRTGFQIAP